ncbi:alcohol dehydrogenase catalytic domain-containing protein [Microbacterium aurantiacum]|uniref:alcohol dehydrogenase catalytic domain-containing protein n=1 Tax=Microbacterium aurantiacum TaxID=162393 RepID=UPI000C80954F|nr:alcohol dehydrogenase catalytic domain-containing protein [Microbacterium aurantiacum]
MGTSLMRPAVPRTDVALRPAALAMVWLGVGHPHETIAVPGVALADADVLVAVEMSTICDSDVDTVLGLRSAPAPLVLGHESVGRVIATGHVGASAVDGTPLRIGDRVVWSATVSCANCERCRRGMPQQCRSLAEYGHERIGAHGDLTGAFGTHVQLREGTAIVRVPESLPAVVLAPASGATATAWAAVARARRDRDLEGASVRIYGAGLVGLSAAAIATEFGASVEVFDRDPSRRELAARYGAGSSGRVPDVVIEASGHAVAAAIDAVDLGGTVVLTGRPPRPEPVALDADGIVRRLITVSGVRDYSGTDLAEAVAFLAGRGRAYPFAEVVGDVRPLADIDDALRAASAPDAPLRIGLIPGR